MGSCEGDDSESRLLTIFEQGIVGFAKLSLSGGIIRANDRFCELTGLRRETLIARPFPDIALAEDQPASRTLLEQMLSGDRPRTIQQRYLREDGRVVATSAGLSLIRDAGGHPMQFAVLLLDITEQERTHVQLKDSLESLQLALAGARLGVLHWNLLTGQWTASADCRAYFGWRPETPVNRDIVLSAVHPKDRDRVDQVLAASVSSLGHYETEFRVLWPDGSERCVVASGRTFGSAEGLPERMEAVVNDITSRKEAEAASMRAEVAEAANLAKSAFLANMSHELRTPLNAISGMAYLLKCSSLTAEQMERVDTISSAGEHLLQVIEAILELSRIEAGKIDLREAVLDTDALIAQVVAMLADQAHAKGLALRIEGSAPLPLLLGDPVRLAEMLLNFTGNAIKFTEAGSVTVSCRLDDESADGMLIRFEVRDTGIGIAQDVLPRLFGAFEQADNSHTRKYGGSGLGLAISRHLARLMGGDAGVDSQLGAGSTFWFTARLGKATLPGFTAPVPQLEPADARLRRDHRGKRVLLAEDDPVSREIMVALGRLAGLSADAVTNGEEAVAAFQSADYDLILMDVQMPLLNGLDACRRIRASARGAHVPIIALTALAFGEDRKKCLDAGMDDFISKPVGAAPLFDVMLKHLDRPR